MQFKLNHIKLNKKTLFIFFLLLFLFLFFLLFSSSEEVEKDEEAVAPVFHIVVHKNRK